MLWIRAVCAAILVALCAAPARAAETIEIGYISSSALPLFIAQEQGFLARHGITAHLTLVTNGSTMPAALMGGSLRIAPVTLPGMLLGSDNGLDLVAIVGTDVIRAGERYADVVVRPDLAAASAQDLAHATIALPGLNGFAHLMLLRWFDLEGVATSGVRFVEVAFPKMGDALRTRSVDAAVPINPFLDRITASGAGRLLPGLNASIPPGSVTTLWCMTREFAAGHRDIVRGFRAAIVEGIAWHNAHPADADDTISRFIPLSKAILATIPKPHFTADVDPRQIAFWGDLLKKDGLVAKPATPASLIAAE